MKFKWLLLIIILISVLVVAGCGLTPGESFVGNAKATGREKIQSAYSPTNNRVVSSRDSSCYYDSECASGQICQGAITNMANPASNKKGSCVKKVTYCMQGFIKKVKGTGMPGQDCPDQFNTYSCVEGVSTPKNACPVGSNFYYTQDALYYGWFKNSPLDENGNLIKNHYFCVSDKVFKSEDLTCAKGFKLTEQWGYNDNPWDFKQDKYKYNISATDSTKAASCIQHKQTIPGETECLKKGWIFRCDIVDSEKPKEQPEEYIMDIAKPEKYNPKFPCGTSGAKVMGGMGGGYCCGNPPQ